MNQLLNIGNFISELRETGPHNDWLWDDIYDDIHALGYDLISNSIYQ